MPRDGSGNYTKPFDPVVDGTTIEPTVYNGFVDDAATQFIGPTPILSGGTNATSAPTALFNLGGEKATQVVGGDTDFNTHVFVPGSFRAAAGVTGAPNGTAEFAGHCYINEALANPPTNQNVVVEARDMTSGITYTRIKTAGVWGAWATAAVSAAGTHQQLQYNNTGALTGVPGTFVNTTNGAVTFNTGTITSVTPAVACSQTWNNAAGIFAAFRIDVTPTLYHPAASFIECRSSLTTKFKVGIEGIIRSGGYTRCVGGHSVPNSVTLVAVSGLTVTLGAAQSYQFEAELYVTCAAAGGVKAAIGGTATTVNMSYTGYAIADNAIKGKATGTAFDTVVASTLTTETSGIVVRITGHITTTAAGTLLVKFAQNTSTATPTAVLTGSWFRVVEVA